MSDLSQSFAYVENAIASLPEQLALALESKLPARPAFRTIVTSGIGASEGPARLLAALLAEAGLAARFTALSAFGRPPEACAGSLLVLFSQGLSPNARLTLDHATHFDTRWLVTSIDERAAPAKQQLLEQFTRRGFVPIVLPPTSEPNTLLRLVGPTVATLGALRLAALLRDDASLAARARSAPAAYRAAPAHEPLPEHALAIVSVGVPIEWANAQRWKLLEALLRWDPPVWDVLQFAHGPLQAFHHQRLTLLLLERGRGSALVPRLEATLNPALHRVIHLTSQHDDELACFEHAAAIDALLLRTLRARPRDLFDWPARHGDGPLYGLGGPST